jgi:hypothetical protein
MGLVLKPRKCKSLSIKAGGSEVEEFRIGNYTVPSIKDDPYMKFHLTLGKKKWHKVIKTKFSRLILNQI